MRRCIQGDIVRNGQNGIEVDEWGVLVFKKKKRDIPCLEDPLSISPYFHQILQIKKQKPL
jgi:hypothetical protein